MNTPFILRTYHEEFLATLAAEPRDATPAEREDLEIPARAARPAETPCFFDMSAEVPERKGGPIMSDRPPTWDARGMDAAGEEQKACEGNNTTNRALESSDSASRAALSSRDYALDLAKRGLRPFRTRSDTLTPKKAGWTEFASSDETAVNADFSDAVGDSVIDNIGVATEGILGIDVDVKDRPRAIVSLESLGREGLTRDTFTVETPSGGLHL